MSTSEITSTAVSQINDRFLIKLFFFSASNTNVMYELSELSDELQTDLMFENQKKYENNFCVQKKMIQN